MSTWRIDPAGVQSLMDQAITAQEQLHSALEEEDVQGIFAGLGSGGVFAAELPNAVGELLQDQQQNLMTICNRVAAGISGVVNATVAYQRGQEEMAGSFHREMLEASADGDFSFFERFGYGQA